ncbi:GntR family transcriptional regulator, transcriptional repressor for pyruvate dehydrogenase complex [Pseudomonas sp. NFACC45]|nr:GntR family transcriptional regulator, transcriptional repressor for pyruvate dehydrogenase complex [Pseudomonas sp. NFACC45]
MPSWFLICQSHGFTGGMRSYWSEQLRRVSHRYRALVFAAEPNWSTTCRARRLALQLAVHWPGSSEKIMNSIARAVPEVALQAIRKLIVDEGFAPGDALPSQRDLALQLGVSRASLREALSSLSALGVISVQPGKGVFVQSSVEVSRSELAPGWPFAAQASPVDIFQLRYALEGFAAGLAAVTLSADELDTLEDNVEAMRRELKSGDFDAAARLDFEFHRRILQASGNQAMLSILTASADIFLESQKLPFIRAERAMETWQEHRKILRALARRASAGAQKAMQEHVRNAALRTGISFVAPAAP